MVSQRTGKANTARQRPAESWNRTEEAPTSTSTASASLWEREARDGRKRGEVKTGRKGSAGTSGIGVRVVVWGWENRDTHGGPERYRPITTGNNFIFMEKPMSKVIKAIHETVVNGKMPSKAIASAIGKPYTTLMRETNPYDPGAKLGVETFMAIIQTTGDVGPLELMVQELGYVLQSRK